MKGATMEQNCMNCRFERNEECRLRPAEMVVVAMADGMQSSEIVHCYPPACEQDWCGKWEPVKGKGENDENQGDK